MAWPTVESLWLSGKGLNVGGLILYGNSEFFLCPTFVTRRKKIFKLTHSNTEYGSDPRSNEHYLNSGENKA